MLGTCVVPHFHGILSGKPVYSIILVIEGHLQGEKVNSKGKGIKNIILTSTNSSIYV